jgi:O-antigen/teichoic acid export membrane protein
MPQRHHGGGDEGQVDDHVHAASVTAQGCGDQGADGRIHSPDKVGGAARGPMRSTMKSDPSPTVTANAGSGSSAGDMLFGIGGKLLYAATRVALPPLALTHMGLAEYGLWAACFVLVGYLGMAASGFTLVYLRGTARHHAAGDTAAIGRLLSTGTLAMAALTLLLLAALALALPVLLALFQVPAEQQAVARVLWLGAAAVFLADMSLGAFANVLHAIGRVRQEQRVWVAAFVLETGLIVVFLHAGMGVLGLLAAFALRYLFSASANAVLACRALPGLRLSWRHFEPALLRDFFGFGAGMQLSGLWATTLHSADRLIAGALLGPQATALVDMAAKLPTTAASIGSSASAVAVSASARHDVQGQAQALRCVYGDASRITVASLALTLPFLAAFAQPLTQAWLGALPAQAAVAALLPALALALHAHMLTGPATAVSRGRGRLGADFSYAALRTLALVLAVAACVFTASTGLHTLVPALAQAQAVAALGFLAAAHWRLCGEWRTLLSTVLLPSAAAQALAWGLAWALTGAISGKAASVAFTTADRLPAIASLCGALALWLPLAALLLGACLLQPHERAALLRRFLKPLNWSRA